MDLFTASCIVALNTVNPELKDLKYLFTKMVRKTHQFNIFLYPFHPKTVIFLVFFYQIVF
jgi:hypothetical protein